MEAKQKLTELVEVEKQEVDRLEAEFRSATAKNQAWLAVASEFSADCYDWMHRKIADRKRKEAAELAEIERKLEAASERLSAFTEALKWIPKDGEEAELRDGSQMAKVRDLIRASGRPMALGEILEALQLTGDDKKRNSLRGSLGGYAREGRVFTKEAAPDTFGLIEFSKRNGQCNEENKALAESLKEN